MTPVEQNPESTPARRTRPLPRWPGYAIMFPAAVAIWAGWVGLGQMTGFGVIQLFPGVPYLEQLRINTSITLPIGMEAYAAFAMTIWLSTGIGQRLRDYARISALAAGGAGLVGQIGFHLMSAAGWQTAPWPIITLVSCVPVIVAMVAGGLLHLIREENELIAAAASAPRTPPAVAPPAPAPVTEPTVGNPLAGRAPVRPDWTPAVNRDPAPIAPQRPEPRPAPEPAPIAPAPAPVTKDRTEPEPKPQPVRPRPAPAPAIEPDPVALQALGAMSDETMAALSVDQLRQLARKCGLTQRGARAVVLDRLRQHRDSNGRTPVGGGVT